MTISQSDSPVMLKTWQRRYLKMGWNALVKERAWRAGLYLLLNYRKLAQRRMTAQTRTGREQLSPFTYTMH